MAQAQSSREKILLESGTNELEVIAFTLSYSSPDSGEPTQNFYGINAGKVKELVAMPAEVTAIAGSGHSCIQGVFLLRNRTITLIDLARWFGYEPLPDPEIRRKWTVIVTEINGKLFGFVSHGVDKVYRVSWAEMKPPPPLIAQCHSITGICLIENRLIQMVDFEQIISEVDPSMRMQASASTLAGHEGQTGQRILIADDSGLIRGQIARVLEKSGFDVLAFDNGQAAWQYLEEYRDGKTDDGRLSAVISDIEMPRMDGHHLCMKIKSDASLKQLPVILFSSMINEALKRKGHEVGADDQITKPEIDTLVSRLRACIAATS
ncbi:MAG: chemotaxis protein [Thermodesulfobacteriota bacterium]|jgi:two-component system chemotaxis response regulator CheV